MRRSLPLDDFSDADVSDAVFAMRHLGSRFGRGPFAVRRNSRFAWGLATLYRAGIVTLRVYRDVAGEIIRDGLITVEVHLREAVTL